MKVRLLVLISKVHRYVDRFGLTDASNICALIVGHSHINAPLMISVPQHVKKSIVYVGICES